MSSAPTLETPPPARRRPSPAVHGFAPVYREGEVNRCPGCGGSQWWVGHVSAECAFCGTALPLSHSEPMGVALGHLYWERDVQRHGWHYGGVPRHGPDYDAAEWEE